MKKLIIMALAVAFAAATQAATVTWALTKTYQPGTTTAASGYAVYLFEVSSSITTESIGAAITGGTFDATKALASGVTSPTGGYSKSGIGNYTADSGAVSWFSVIFDSAAYATAQNYIVTSTVTQTYTSPTGSKTASFANIGTTYQWSEIAPVPEPTSGLLMLLGMGALALRRRRA